MKTVVNTNKSLVISASAGTGKTWVIIARLINLLFKNVELSKITVLTFTNDAVQEIRDRFIKELKKYSKSSNTQLENMLREIGINPNLKNINKAKNLLFNYLIEKDEVRICTFHSFFSEILNLSYWEKEDYINTKINIFKEKHANQVIQDFLNVKNLESYPQLNKIIKIYFSTIGGAYNMRASLFKSLNNINLFNELNETLEREETILSSLEIKNHNYKNYVKDLIAINKNLEIDKNFKDLFLNIELFLEKYQNNADQMILKEITIANNKDIKKSLHKNKSSTKFLNDLYKASSLNIDFKIQKIWKYLSLLVIDLYKKKLHELKLIDYDQIEWDCYKKICLSKDSELLKFKISSNINHILVDEFQDSNQRQWDILKNIFTDIIETSQFNTITIVGDKKQSIYAFRGGKVNLLNDAIRFVQEKCNGDYHELNTSRRSSIKIIDFINNKFQMSENKFKTIHKSLGKVSICEIDANKSNIKSEEAQFISEQIYENFKNNKNKKYSDVMILVRKNSHIKIIEEYLSIYKIPINKKGIYNIFKSPEIIDILKILKFIYFQQDFDKKETYENTFAYLYFKTLGELESFNKKISSCIKYSKTVPAHDLIQKLCSELDLKNLYKSIFDEGYENKIENNINDLILFSIELESGRSISPYEFLFQVDEIKALDSPNSSNSNEDGVIVKTIHGSKGLEADVVFLTQSYDTTRHFKSMDIIQEFKKSKLTKLHLNIGKYNIKKFKSNIYDITEKINQSEELNMMYVACTRAKKELYITGNLELNKESFFNFFHVK